MELYPFSIQPIKGNNCGLIPIYLLVFFPVFSSRPLCPKQKIFADILRSCGTTIRHVLIVFIVPGKTPAKFVVPGL